jgi:hypothetical protein
MSETKFTPGPWKLEANPNYLVNGREVFNFVTARAFDGSWKQICHVSGGSPQSRDANARLIAEAPKLFETLQKIREVIKNSGYWWMDCPGKGGFDTAEIDALIAKVEGRP